MIEMSFNTNSIDSYRQFLAVRSCPVYRFVGGKAIVPDEYASIIGATSKMVHAEYHPLPSLFDYQRDISQIAIRKKKFALFIDCGLGKSLCILEFCKHAIESTGKRVLLVTPSMVVKQIIEEARRFYGDTLKIEQVKASELGGWLTVKSDGVVGVTNYEAIKDDLPNGTLGGLVCDESSYLKSHYGSWAIKLIEMGRGVEYKLCATGTPAPNDRIEFANHAVFLDRARTVNEFLATYFINRGETQNRWELKPHALKSFYRSLASWSIFMTNPATYGWKDNVGTMPPIITHIHDVPLTDEQRKAAQGLTGNLLTVSVGGIGQRGKLSQISKGADGMSTNKPGFIRDLIASWPDESTIVWCHYNQEQDSMEEVLTNYESIRGGDTSNPKNMQERIDAIERFKSGQSRSLITKGKILGFGVNLQIATRQVFSGLNDSWETFHQCVKRSNRVGSTRPLNVHIPVTELEVPFVDNILRKAHRVEEDSKEQEALFKEVGLEVLFAC